MDEPWPLYDECPAHDDWPGGKRYGYRSEDVARDWTPAELASADLWGIVLPSICRERFDTWYDQPYWILNHMRPVYRELSMFDPDASPVEIERYATTARRYGVRRPLFDLKRAIIAERRRRMLAEQEEGR